MTQVITIGVDHGYAAMKTAHFSFPSGLAEYAHEPYTKKNVLCYGGRYYVIGSGRQPLQKDKTADDNYYLLTLAAIAREIAYRNAPAKASVILAAGLPLTSFGREKNAFRNYLLRDGKPVCFSYEGISYEICVQDVKLFPQGYAAILQHSDLLNEPSVILADIGGWTVDVMRLDNRIPNAASCRSLELGMIRCLDEIAEQVRRNLSLSLTSVQIEAALRGTPDSMDERVKAIVQREAGLYARKILSAIAETGLDCRAMPVVFLGGGAGLMKRYLPTNSVLRPIILDDDKLNAQAYERLAGQMEGRTES